MVPICVVEDGVLFSMKCHECGDEYISDKKIWEKAEEDLRALRGTSPWITEAPDLNLPLKYTGGSKKVGIKYDSDKPRFSLFRKTMAREIAQIVDILTMGAKKYFDDNWINVGMEDESRTRYLDAFERHYSEHLLGNLYDDESGKLHLAHAAVNIMFMLYVLNEDIERNSDV